jgi:hypothetical protein
VVATRKEMFEILDRLENTKNTVETTTVVPTTAGTPTVTTSTLLIQSSANPTTVADILNSDPTTVTVPTTSVPTTVANQYTTFTTVFSTPTTTTTTTPFPDFWSWTNPYRFPDRWWAWVLLQFSTIRNLGQWLLLSWYLPSIYDLIVGMLCLLNSTYILYKICFSDKRRGKESRLSAAMSRLFGRPKTEFASVSSSDIEMANINPTPTAPPAPRMPTVKTIEREIRPSRKRIVRYVEEVESEPQEEAMPLRSAMRRTYREQEMENERRYLKRQAPSPPPTPLVAAVYFRDNIPLFMRK